MPDLSPLAHRLYLAEIERLARLPAPPLPHRLAAAIRRLRRRMRLAPPPLVSPAA